LRPGIFTGASAEEISMTDPSLDVVGVGNAIVDVLTQADDALLDRLGLAKGAMTLIDAARADELYRQMGAGIEVSGGSAANTLAGIASLGGRGAYIGKVRDDQLGTVFDHDIRAAGVDYRSRPVTSGPSTARCLIFVTPDAQRTMQTFLGVSVELGPDDIDPEAIGQAAITYLEGYLFDKEPAKEAFVKAAEIAHAAGRKVALSLSDPFCVDRHRAAFLHLAEGHIDILFANEAEITSLYQVENFDHAVAKVRGHCETAVLTRGADGSVIVTADEFISVAAEPVAQVVDTTGAGDLFAAGVLHGITQGYELAQCGRIGGIAAAEIISHYGARPETPLAPLIAAKLA
jgi:sugar/nucleoside kinase (ribokinase family)